MNLSASELICLRWIAEGRALETITVLEDLAPQDILAVVASALEELNTESIRGAIEKAQALGLI